VLLLVGVLLVPGCRPPRDVEPTGRATPVPSEQESTAGDPSTVVTVDGQPLNPLESGTDGWTVLIFMRTTCPVANRYAPEINRLSDEFSGRGVRFYRVYVDPRETPQQVTAHTEQYLHHTPALRDPAHYLARRLDAHVTPEAVLLDGRGEVLYQGRIDDRFIDFGKTRPEPRRHDLQLALQAALAGEDIQIPRTRAVGCLIADVQS
jgi:hypothetical protein